MTLQEIVDRSRRIVFFGGAGVSTESGIPDFRSVDGLYHQQYDYPPEQILSRSFFDENPAGFIRYFQGEHFVLINRDPTPADNLADLVLHQKVGQVLSQIQVR